MRLLAATVAAIAAALAWYFALRSRSRGFPLASDGVFFRQFPGTGSFANRRLSAAELRRRVAAWRTPYTPGPLTPEQHAQFFDDGFVIVPNLAPEAELRGAIDAVDGLVDTIARRLHAAGKVSSLHQDAGFHRRLIELEKEFPRAGVLLHKAGILPEGIQNLWAHQTLVGAAQQLLGEDADIAGHPVWNLRCKTPDAFSIDEATVPWHQDTAYLDEECWDKLQVTAWVPLVDANATNGCMQVLRGAHRPGGTVTHACCAGGTWYVETTPEELVTALGADLERDLVTCEVPYGSVLLLNNLIPHRSLPNYSDRVRWSLDLRWQRAGEPNGFSSLKPSVLMKPAAIPIDEFRGSADVRWGGWADVDRSAAQVAEVGAAAHAEFDTTIAGPWMRAWPRLHDNRHTAQLGS